jgi:sugar phosphate isomerase/epimerase
MRFGVCAGVDRAPDLAAAGYDYIELSVAGDLIPEADEAAWAERRRRIEAMPLVAEAFNSLIRVGKIVGPEADPDRLRRYVESALQRAAQVGGRLVVFGSGGARNVPPDFDPAHARQQILDFLGYCADSAERTGVTVAIEPLHRGECNLINRVEEGAALAREIGRPGVRNLADTFHMEREEEPIDVIVDTADVLAHAHTADTNRLAPGTGHYDHVAFFHALRRADYDARVSIECSFPPDFAAQAARSLTHLRAAYAAARA